MHNNLMFALGIFLGNVFVHGLIKKEWAKGFFIGIVAALLCLAILPLLPH